MSSIDAKIHAAQDLIYSIQNPAPEISPEKLGNGQKEALRTLEEISRKSTPPRNTSEGASQGGSPIETQRGEPRNIPNENCITIKTSHQ